MQFLLLVYTDPALLDALPEGEFDRWMKGCIEHADELKRDGRLLASQQLEAPSTAKSVRVRQGRTQVLDGPFAETKEVIGGWAILEAESKSDALRIAREFMELHRTHWPVFQGEAEVRPMFDPGMGP